MRYTDETGRTNKKLEVRQLTFPIMPHINWFRGTFLEKKKKST